MKNLALIGPRGVGKSKIAKKISKITNMPVVSTDSIAVYELGGISISNYIKSTGEDWGPFRELEYKILNNLSRADGIIIDCGGGILFDIDEKGNEIPSSRKIDLLRSISEVVFLDDDLKNLIEKVSNDESRPNLSKSISYKSILEKRIPIYKESSHFRLYLNGMKKEVAAKRIIELVNLDYFIFPNQYSDA